jgi:hypothetical protein
MLLQYFLRQKKFLAAHVSEINLRAREKADCVWLTTCETDGLGPWVKEKEGGSDLLHFQTSAEQANYQLVGRSFGALSALQVRRILGAVLRAGGEKTYERSASSLKECSGRSARSTMGGASLSSLTTEGHTMSGLEITGDGRGVWVRHLDGGTGLRGSGVVGVFGTLPVEPIAEVKEGEGV